MKALKMLLTILCLLLFFKNWAFGFFTHNADISRSFDNYESSVNCPITITINFSNFEINNLRGFYYSEQIPNGLEINTISVKINDTNIPDYSFESGTSGDVYSEIIPYRWILETPASFDENNPLPLNANLEIIYTISSAQEGTFNLDEFSWIGYYQALQEEAFGHSEQIDKQIITFTDPSLILLDQLKAIFQEEQVTITWTTASEIDNVGYNIWRTEGEGEEYIKINTLLIESKGKAIYGADYSFIDDTIKSGIIYYYKLEDINTSGLSTFHGPVSASIAIIPAKDSNISCITCRFGLYSQPPWLILQSPYFYGNNYFNYPSPSWWWQAYSPKLTAQRDFWWQMWVDTRTQFSLIYHYNYHD